MTYDISQTLLQWEVHPPVHGLRNNLPIPRKTLYNLGLQRWNTFYSVKSRFCLVSGQIKSDRQRWGLGAVKRGEKMLKQILLDVQKVFWGSESEALLLRDMAREGETSHLKTTSVSTLTFKRFGLLILFWIATLSLSLPCRCEILVLFQVLLPANNPTHTHTHTQWIIRAQASTSIQNSSCQYGLLNVKKCMLYFDSAPDFPTVLWWIDACFPQRALDHWSCDGAERSSAAHTSSVNTHID